MSTCIKLPPLMYLDGVRTQVSMKEIMDTNRFSREQAAQAPGWLQSMRSDAPIVSETEEYGIQNFVYRQAAVPLPYRQSPLW